MRQPRAGGLAAPGPQRGATALAASQPRAAAPQHTTESFAAYGVSSGQHCAAPSAEREIVQLQIELRKTQEVLNSRDELIDGYKKSLEELRDQLVAKEMALASCEQRLRATESERQLLAAQVERLELGARRAAESHSSAMTAEAERREQELGFVRSDREEQVTSLRRRLGEMAEQLDGARADLRELLAERSQVLQQAEAAQRQALERAGEAEAAARSLAATERALADLREERQQALALRDQRIRELTAQVAELGRAGDSRSAEQQAALSTWMNAYNALRSAADKQRGELLALQSSERRTSDSLKDTERQLRDSQEAAVTLRLELQRQAAQATASEMEAKSLRRELQRAWAGTGTAAPPPMTAPVAAVAAVPLQVAARSHGGTLPTPGAYGGASVEPWPQTSGHVAVSQPVSAALQPAPLGAAYHPGQPAVPVAASVGQGIGGGFTWSAAAPPGGPSAPSYGYAAAAPLYPGPHVSSLVPLTAAASAGPGAPWSSTTAGAISSACSALAGLSSLSCLAGTCRCCPCRDSLPRDGRSSRGVKSASGAPRHGRTCKSASATPVKASGAGGEAHAARGEAHRRLGL
ncbi:hypothetical protein HYH02_009490 [Chlamydomonas schloesseri]|uniref:Uncharacterized protein n=1 Tax=Chlamydomonas schloesseri TaxID=2026947 RepID=A0A835TPS3_9CHLO|nr:hypothetical protein HYH02_009490 [Chlamydomonas schloesseri]|eukprot:KAG2443076.1 hypothetical protein HYH02_009490 [Chlamydomonas schloesseri]